MSHQKPTEREKASSGSGFSVQSPLVAFLLLLVSIVAVYSNTLDVPWHFDDQRNIVEREDLHLTELSWAGVKDTFFYGNRLYRPVACLSFALNHYFHRFDLAGYHAVNITVHVLAAWFLFLFIRTTLKAPLNRKFYQEKAFLIAFLASLLWALHPIQTQSVTYIVQRMAGLAGMFYIMSMYFYARARILEQGIRKWILFFFSFLAAILALVSKENAILLPFSVALYEVMVLNHTPVKNLLKSHWKLLVIFLSFMTIAMFGYLAIYYGGRVTNFLSGYQHRIFSLEERLLSEPRIVLFYISLLLYPHPSRFSICHNIECSTSLFQPATTILSIVAIALLVTGAVIYRKKYPLAAFSVLFFFLNHTIESTFIPLELAFEHRNYIPSMLFFLPFTMLFARGFFHPKATPVIRGSATALVIVVPIALACSSYLRNFDWKSGKALWMNAAEKNPNSWRPFHNVGLRYLEEQDYTEALKWFRAALIKSNTTIHAEKHKTFYNIGVTYQAMGLTDAALAAYCQADQMHPGIAKVHVNKGVIHMDREEWSKALDAFQEAISLDPALAEGHSNLGWLLFQFNDHKNGLRHLRKAVNLNPEDLVTQKRLAYALLRQGKLKESQGRFKALRKDRPEDLAPLLFLAEIYAKTGRMAEARSTLSLMANQIGHGGLSRLSQMILKQEDHPLTMLPDKDILMAILKTLKDKPGRSLRGRLPATVKQEGTSDQQQGYQGYTRPDSKGP